MRKKEIQFIFRATPEEAALIKSKIAASGMRQQDYLLHAATGTEIIDTSPVKDLLPQLAKIGGNLNQIARKLNTAGKYELSAAIYSDSVKTLKGLNEIWQQLRQLLPTRH